MDEIRFLLCMKFLGREVSHQHKKKDKYDKGGSETCPAEILTNLSMS